MDAVPVTARQAPVGPAADSDVDFGRPHWPLHLAFGLHYSEQEERGKAVCFILCEYDVVSKAKLWELDAGVLAVFRSGKPARPFVGGGLALVDADLSVRRTSLEDDDRSVGIFLRGGAIWDLPDRGGRARGHLGVEGKVLSGTEIRLLEREGDADYFQLGFLLGFTW